MSYQPRMCLVVLMGIPCSGKSFFRLRLEKYVKGKNNSVLGSVLLCSICYDDYTKVRNPQWYLDSAKWKEERFKVFTVARNMLSYFLEGRKTPFGVYFPNITIVNEGIANPDCIIVVIDDNMYYRSMRYEYFKLARTLKISFIQIYLAARLEDALKYNKLRSIEMQVPEDVIESMFDKIEPPQAKNTWESNSIQASSLRNKCEIDSLICEVFICIKKILSNPIQCDELENSTAKQTSRMITDSNCLHKIDNALKKIVAVLIKEEIKKNNNKIYEISKRLSDKRLGLLKEIKEGSVILPIDLTKPTSDEDILIIKPILLKSLQD